MAPSIASRRISRWPAGSAVSSIMWMMILARYQHSYCEHRLFGRAFFWSCLYTHARIVSHSSALGSAE